jgi:hypothetical protein
MYIILILIFCASFSVVKSADDEKETVPQTITFCQAFELKPNIILEIADIAKQSYTPKSPTGEEVSTRRRNDIFIKSGRKVGVIDEQPEQVVIAFKGVDSLFSSYLMRYLQICPSLVGEEGCMHRGVLSAFLPISQSSEYRDFLDITREGRSGKEYIFTGHGFGGALAILAALDFSTKTMEKRTSPQLQENQVKIVTFSSPKVVDKALKNELITRFGKGNILQFVHCLDCTETVPFMYRHVGIPIRILPSEQLRDCFYDHARWSKFVYGTLAVIQSIWVAKEGTEKNTKTIASIIASLAGIQTFIIGVPSIPSKTSLFMSFMGTKHNVEDLGDIAEIPDSVGSVSLISFQRGFFGWLYGLLGR